MFDIWQINYCLGIMQTSHVTASSSSSSSLSFLKWFHIYYMQFSLSCISKYDCLFFHAFLSLIVLLYLCFRVTWGICTLICIQGRGNIQVVLILQLKGAAGFLKRSTNFLYVKVDNYSSSPGLLLVMLFVFIIKSILNYQFTSTYPRWHWQ